VPSERWKVVKTAWWMCLAVQPADLTTAVQEDLEESDDAGVVDLNAGIADCADSDWKGEALQQREVDVDVEPLRLETGEAAGDGLEPLADGIEMVQSLLEMEIGEVVARNPQGGSLTPRTQKVTFIAHRQFAV
jgi:hypothetical protein